MKLELHPIKILTVVILSVGAMTTKAQELFDNPMILFKEALIPALSTSESGKLQTTWRGFYMRADHQSQIKDEGEPSEFGIFLDVAVRDGEEVSHFSDALTEHAGITIRKVCFPPNGTKLDQGLVVTLKYGASANPQALKAIGGCITDIKSKIEKSGAASKHLNPVTQ